MYSSHSYPYQLGSNQPPQQPAQYSSFTPQPTPHYPQPQPPQYPQPPSPQHPPHPSNVPHHQSQPEPPPRYTPFTPVDNSTVSMPLLQRQEPDPTTGNQEIGDPRFVLLWSMDTEELQCLLDNEEKFSEMVTNMEEVKQKKLEKEMSMAENRSLAEFNLSRGPRLNEGRSQFMARLHEAHRLKDSYTVGKAKLDSVREQNSLDTALALMQASTANAEEESEEVADDFLKGDLTLEDFLDKFMPKRQTAHLRHIKAEKMQEILNQRQRASSTASSHQVAATQNSSMPPYGSPHQHQPQTSSYQHTSHGNPPYGYQPQRPAPRAPYPGPSYGPGAPSSMPTLGSYPH